MNRSDTPASDRDVNASTAAEQQLVIDPLASVGTRQPESRSRTTGRDQVGFRDSRLLLFDLDPQEELADANQRLQVALEIEGFSKFADFFFDGLIADWVVQSKIQRASSACSSTMSRVRSAISECRKRLADTERDLKKVTDDRQAFVERA